MGRVTKPEEKSVGIFEVLHVEHRDVSALFEQIEATCEESPADAKDLFTVLHDSLLAHARSEETVVYPRFRKIEGLDEKMAEAREEHAVVETLLAELRAGDMSSEQWLPQLMVLKENVEHHVQEEEGEIFELAKKDIDAAESRKLALAFLQRKQRHTGEPEVQQAAARKPPKKRGLLARVFGRA